MIAAPLVSNTLTTGIPSLPIDVRGLGAVGLQVAGTWTGTITFEASIDGRTFVALNMVPSNSATPASTTTGSGAWTANVAGFTLVRARWSTTTSGAPEVTLLAANLGGRF